eukprot:2336572-Rhodomonas_salina.1
MRQFDKAVTQFATVYPFLQVDSESEPLCGAVLKDTHFVLHCSVVMWYFSSLQLETLSSAFALAPLQTRMPASVSLESLSLTVRLRLSRRESTAACQAGTCQAGSVRFKFEDVTLSATASRCQPELGSLIIVFLVSKNQMARRRRGSG